jgi:hypothetical protein
VRLSSGTKLPNYQSEAVSNQLVDGGSRGESVGVGMIVYLLM